jgi:hypothetical protein
MSLRFKRGFYKQVPEVQRMRYPLNSHEVTAAVDVYHFSRDEPVGGDEE